MKNRSNEVNNEDKKGMVYIWKIFQEKTLPITLKRKVYDQCIIPTVTYGRQTWTLNKQLCHKLQAQKAMTRKMLNIKLKHTAPTTKVRKKTQVIDEVEYIQRHKLRCVGHIARDKDNRWTKRCTEWQPRSRRRDRGRPEARWIDNIRKAAGPEWQGKAQDRREWKTSIEGHILQLMDKASK
ncbi:endonuclease-reverse transcriptase [Plakobranchus ocellatus]|uniref:Endonuclease-reverse transcriptase n=1 Tax=Plakobranchus ocellatus TaxID=259542 RepID=A0AAV3YL16_9GAST|nr:endonuclease-reverse transcriptase [Plakobranchus ocellatus]